MAPEHVEAEDGDAKRGIQSLEIGATLLRVICDAPGPLQLKEIAQRAGMSPSKAYRYLVSYAKCGLVKQDPLSARYGLGPFCLELGLAMFGRMDETGTVLDGLARVTELLSHDAHVTVWSAGGPMIARWRQGAGDISIRVREGSVLPLLASATGRVWSCHLPPEKTRDLFESEVRASAAENHCPLREARAEANALIVAVEASGGLARADGDMRKGVSAISGPVFNRDGIAFAMTLLGEAGDPDLRLDGQTAQTFRTILSDLSAQLGR
jgi:DNA-binding IclR family transcriptional regulator